MHLHIHRQILRSAFAAETDVPARVLGWIIQGNLRSDLDQFSPERHFDNAPDRERLAELWQIGLRRTFLRSVSLAADPRRRAAALRLFGECSHSLADFYAHTNWVELHAAQGLTDRLAPLTGDRLDPGDLPPDLESGFFSLRYGLSGCPKKAGCYQAPPGFRYCHQTLAKDGPNHGQGAVRLDPRLPTCFEIAFELAVRATRDLWAAYRQALAAAGPETLRRVLGEK